MTLPRPVRGVLLDMDGTLCDTETVWRDAALVAATDLGVELDLGTYLSIVGIPLEQGRARMLEALGPSFPLDAWFSRCEDVVHGSEIPLKAGVLDLLDALEAAGLPAALCTSSGHAAVERHLGGRGVLERLSAVVAAGDYARSKPEPDPYLTAAARIGVPASDCLAVEDSPNGLRSAHAAGCVTVMVPDLVAPTDEVRALCDLVVSDLGALARGIAARTSPTPR